ncbi:Embryonic stem cell-specific 5-hydroxymethylcytosine-binding protein [Amphibalanus amphitrite]|uniref:Abasic site processing protein HMCES n=1 Tax=Amphibalanus amphitrite TaxID=1232801 RepID=A0A6A4WC22_AMPAM|nr:Embryonic stem cell-specific 5-hydroxymethylcytosine-binding protein [Amphibalanus amphitrite]
MCGRTACTLQPDNLSRACSYVPRGGQNQKQNNQKYQKARFMNTPGSRNYQPSQNIAPTGTLPVLIRGDFAGCPDEERIVVSMRWGLIPFFHKGDIAEMKLTTFNARSEEFRDKSMFSGPFKRGQRCVILCDGYYEWKRDGNNKKPYFLYTEQDKKWDICTDVNKLSEEDLWSEEEGWKGPKLTMMAGLFETRKMDDNEVLYSCTILTQASNPHLTWIHHRMPVFLTTPRAVQDWLSAESLEQTALSQITPADSLTWHPVSSEINNVRNRDATYAPVDDTKRSPAAGFMANWLGKGKAEKRPAETEDGEDKPSKR